MLSVKNKVGEVFLFGFDVEVVVSDAVPLTVKQADESHNEAETHADSKTGEADYVDGVELLLQGL